MRPFLDSSPHEILISHASKNHFVHKCLIWLETALTSFTPLKLFEGPKSNVLTKYILIILVLEETTKTIGAVNQDLRIKISADKNYLQSDGPLDFKPNGPICGPVLPPRHKLCHWVVMPWVELGCTSCTSKMSVTSQWS